jgi:hypothetical protein
MSENHECSCDCIWFIGLWERDWNVKGFYRQRTKSDDTTWFRSLVFNATLNKMPVLMYNMVESFIGA